VNVSFVTIIRPFARDLDPDLMTLIYTLDLDILKMYLHNKNEVSSQGFQKFEHEQQRHTHTHTARRDECIRPTNYIHG